MPSLGAVAISAAAVLCWPVGRVVHGGGWGVGASRTEHSAADLLRVATPIMITNVVLARASAAQSKVLPGSPGGRWPDTTVKP